MINHPIFNRMQRRLAHLTGTKRGFTLVEVALIISILGLIIAPFFGFLTQRHQKEALVKEETNNEYITAALASFLAENERYPCPADYSLAPGDAGFGEEEINGAATGCETSGTNITLNNQVYYGALPTQTLGLPLSKSVNTYGWKYLYAITQAHVDPAQLNTAFGAINVNVETARDGSTRLLNTVSFVVVDPGKDGRGSASIRGANNNLAGFFACTGTDNNVANCGTDDAAFISKFAFGSDPSATSYYDDQVFYTLARKADTHWDIANLDASGARTDIALRGSGSLRIGTTVPTGEKLHISSGNMRILGDPTSANLNADSLSVTGDLETTEVVATNQAAAASGFYYTGGPSDASGAACVPNGSWSPSASAVCSGHTETQTNNCGHVQSVTGTLDCSVDGECGSNTYTCDAGTPYNQGSVGQNYTWRCDGIDGGDSSGICTAPKEINGVCGTSTTTPNTCQEGSAIAQNSSTSGYETTYTWKCNGQYGGQQSGQCSLTQTVGTCGTAVNECLSGTLNDKPDFPAGTARWQCDGINGGADSGTCTATTCVNGQVDEIYVALNNTNKSGTGTFVTKQHFYDYGHGGNASGYVDITFNGESARLQASCSGAPPDDTCTDTDTATIGGKSFTLTVQGTEDIEPQPMNNRIYTGSSSVSPNPANACD